MVLARASASLPYLQLGLAEGRRRQRGSRGSSNDQGRKPGRKGRKTRFLFLTKKDGTRRRTETLGNSDGWRKDGLTLEIWSKKTSLGDNLSMTASRVIEAKSTRTNNKASEPIRESVLSLVRPVEYEVWLPLRGQ